ncbi:hypothetical protein AN618_18610 [Fervidicola ferrireducens]|uniref:Uncharacterized protein n=1 Tax=Fervidicola ferrireducens TaxID=520764 RepID=A0A140L4L8_9FIRM|nr:hypothetical protein [Fervidicola ferrireducens]KXG75493.1 hypothetical protein AN618_18610 [Fervidicola ferrireducens]
MVLIIFIISFIIFAISLEYLCKVSSYFSCIRIGHYVYLQKRIFSSFLLLCTHSPDDAIRKLYIDLIHEALPKVIEAARNEDKIILKTHLIRENLFHKLPSSPLIEPIPFSDRILVLLTVISTDILRFIFTGYRILTGKEKKRIKRRTNVNSKVVATVAKKRAERIIKILHHKKYKITWEK